MLKYSLPSNSLAVNRIFKIVATTVLLILFSVLLTAEQVLAENVYITAESVPSESIVRLYKVDDNVYRSAQPDKDGMKELEELGIKSILNLRHKTSDKNYAADTNLKLNWVKMKASKIKDDDIINALRVIDSAKKGDDTAPILIHCKKGSDRTGVVVAMYRVVFNDWSKEQALEELMLPHYKHSNIIYRNIAAYIRDVDVDKIKAGVLSAAVVK